LKKVNPKQRCRFAIFSSCNSLTEIQALTRATRFLILEGDFLLPINLIVSTIFCQNKPINYRDKKFYLFDRKRLRFQLPYLINKHKLSQNLQLCQPTKTWQCLITPKNIRLNLALTYDLVSFQPTRTNHYYFHFGNQSKIDLFSLYSIRQKALSTFPR